MSIYILGGARTPQGSFLGSLSSVPAPKLGATAIEGAISKAGVSKEDIEAMIPTVEQEIAEAATKKINKNSSIAALLSFEGQFIALNDFVLLIYRSDVFSPL